MPIGNENSGLWYLKENIGETFSQWLTSIIGNNAEIGLKNVVCGPVSVESQKLPSKEEDDIFFDFLK